MIRSRRLHSDYFTLSRVHLEDSSVADGDRRNRSFRVPLPFVAVVVEHTKELGADDETETILFSERSVDAFRSRFAGVIESRKLQASLTTIALMWITRVSELHMFWRPK